jgi:hypothetical protein
MLRTKTARGCVAVLALTLTAALGGCGGDDDYANQPRPPAPVSVAAYISDDGISIDPSEVGGGHVVLVVTNQTDSSQRVTLATDEVGGDEPGIERSTSQINPRDTGSLKVNLSQGTYRVGVEDAAIEAARLTVGEQRPSAQDELLQP